jgi:hypothetical protein
MTAQHRAPVPDDCAPDWRRKAPIAPFIRGDAGNRPRHAARDHAVHRVAASSIRGRGKLPQADLVVRYYV